MEQRYMKSTSQSFKTFDAANSQAKKLRTNIVEPEGRVRVRARSDGSFDVVVYKAVEQEKKKE